MKKIVLTLFIAILTTGASIAQGNNNQRGLRNINQTPEEIAKRQTSIMKQRLDLNSDQEKKVYDLNLKYAKEQLKIREVIAAERARLNKNFEEKDNLIRKILTPEQNMFHKLHQRLNKMQIGNRPQFMGKRPQNMRDGMHKKDMQGTQMFRNRTQVIEKTL